jgi:hypothetical protein
VDDDGLVDALADVWRKLDLTFRERAPAAE